MGLDRRGPFGHTGVARHREPPEDSWGTQLPTACRMEECLATFICRIDAVCSKTYPRKAPSAPRVVMLLRHHDSWPTDDRAIIFLDTDELVSYLRTGHHDLDLLIVSVLR